MSNKQNRLWKRKNIYSTQTILSINDTHMFEGVLKINSDYKTIKI